ncbi:MAG: hypothetical protein KC435_14485 [Thermomicrobiales bacterium]|nr:hypothetical protein [Thermomicrobiales bacterium]
MKPISRRALMAACIALPLVDSGYVGAIDMEPITSELYPLIEAFPDRPGEDGRTFNPILGSHRFLWEESGTMPDTYWDPFGMDIRLLFGLTSNDLRCTVSQPGTSPLQIWRHMADSHGHPLARAALTDLGWEVLQEDPYPILAYSGSGEDRTVLAERMAILGQAMSAGAYDHIAFPDDITMVIGLEADVVDTAAGWLFNRTIMDPVRYNFGNLKYVLPERTYDLAWMPPEDLPVAGAESTFACKWIDEDDVTYQTVAVSLDSPDEIEGFVASVESRLQTERSNQYADRVFADFLEIVDVKQEYASVRFDCRVTDFGWDIVTAAQTGDLGFLPPL